MSNVIRAIRSLFTGKKAQEKKRVITAVPLVPLADRYPKLSYIITTPLDRPNQSIWVTPDGTQMGLSTDGKCYRLITVDPNSENMLAGATFDPKEVSVMKLPVNRADCYGFVLRETGSRIIFIGNNTLNTKPKSVLLPDERVENCRVRVDIEDNYAHLVYVSSFLLGHDIPRGNGENILASLRVPICSNSSYIWGALIRKAVKDKTLNCYSTNRGEEIRLGLLPILFMSDDGHIYSAQAEAIRKRK